jgi:HEPN domain-containing protein
MTKKDYIAYWISTSKKDWKVVNDLFKTKKYVYCLFFAHLVLEKLLKANWVKDNQSNHPPKIHNLVYLLKQTKLEIIEQDLDFLLMFNDFQLEGRYPDYQQKIFKLCNQKTTSTFLKSVKKN